MDDLSAKSNFPFDGHLAGRILAKPLFLLSVHVNFFVYLPKYFSVKFKKVNHHYQYFFVIIF